MEEGELVSRIRHIKDSGDYMLNRALEMGMAGSWNFFPDGQEEKKAYGAGLYIYLSQKFNGKVDASEISDPVTLKGFMYELAIRGARLEGNPLCANMDQQKAFQQGIEKVLGQYKTEREKSAETRQEMERFKKGMAIAKDYYGKELLSVMYGLDYREIGEKRLKAYVGISEDIRKRVLARGKMRGSYALPAAALYYMKKDSLTDCLKEGDLNRAIDVCDYLGLLLGFLKRLGDNGKEMRDIGSIHKYIGDIDSKLRALQLEKQEICKRIDNPLYDLERRIEELSYDERYEDAKLVMGELRGFQTEMGKIEGQLIS